MAKNPDEYSLYGLPFIKDEDFEGHVAETLSKMRRYVNYHDFTHPVVDPVKWAFLCQLYGMTNGEAVDFEVQRQVEKSNNNVIGYFHQHIFRYAPAGWWVPGNGEGGGYDLVNKQQHIYVEIKNGTQHNSSEQAGLWMRMQRTVDLDPEAKCYLVEVLAPQSGERPFYFAPQSRTRGALYGTANEHTNAVEAICQMSDLLDDFDDREWHGDNFRDSYEEGDLYRDKHEMGPYSMLGGTRKIDVETLTPEEQNYFKRIRRASMDWLYGQVWGQEHYFFDMLEQLPLAIWNVADGGQYKEIEPTDTVQYVLRRKRFALDNELPPDDPEMDDPEIEERCFQAYKRLYRHWVVECYSKIKE